MKLWLEIEPGDCKPYEVECEFKNPFCIQVTPSTAIHCNNGRLLRDDTNAYIGPCTRCHGSDTRSVRLVGKVEVEAESEYETSDVLYCIQVYQQEPEFKSIYTEGDADCVVNAIIKAHKEGTLPDSLYQSKENPHGLREIGVPE